MSSKIWFLLVAAILVAAALTSENNQPTQADAWLMAQHYLGERLKAPASAEFTAQSIEDMGGGRFRIVGWVDSQNSFGAMLRTRFECEIAHQGEDRWQLTHLVLEER